MVKARFTHISTMKYSVVPIRNLKILPEVLG